MSKTSWTHSIKVDIYPLLIRIGLHINCYDCSCSLESKGYFTSHAAKNPYQIKSTLFITLWTLQPCSLMRPEFSHCLIQTNTWSYRLQHVTAFPAFYTTFSEPSSNQTLMGKSRSDSLPEGKWWSVSEINGLYLIPFIWQRQLRRGLFIAAGSWRGEQRPDPEVSQGLRLLDSHESSCCTWESETILI